MAAGAGAGPGTRAPGNVAGCACAVHGSAAATSIALQLLALCMRRYKRAPPRDYKSRIQKLGAAPRAALCRYVTEISRNLRTPKENSPFKFIFASPSPSTSPRMHASAHFPHHRHQMLSHSRRVNTLIHHLQPLVPSTLVHHHFSSAAGSSPPAVPPRLVVIGGVAGGASVAARARRLAEDADITVLEKGSDVSFANCGMPYHIGNTITDPSKLLLHTPQSLSTLLKLKVRANTAATKIDREKKLVHITESSGKTDTIPYDKLVLSMGAFPIVPPLPGLTGNPKVVTLRNMDDMRNIKARVQDAKVKNVVVLGAGFIGVEMAEQLAEIGKHVTLVDRESGVLPVMDVDMTQPLLQQLDLHGVQTVLSDGVKGITEQGGACHVELQSGRQLVCDLVVLSIGVRPDTTLAKAADIVLAPSGHVKVNEFHQTSDTDIYAVGDCVLTRDGVLPEHNIAAALAGPANRQARLVADHIYAPGLAAGYPGSLGSAILKCFDAAGGLTGWTEKRLKANKIPYKVTVVSGFGHASYYPGAQQVTVKLCWCPKTLRLLGGQVVGGIEAGVDKRLDVLATALRNKMTIDQMVHLELSYAPPFGNAKDVLNVAAFTAMNQHNGLVNAKHSVEDLEDNIQIVDVREAVVASVKPLQLPNVVNMPLAQLRQRCVELDKSKPVMTVCNVGKTSYFAARVLSQCGFNEVYSLQGGVSTHGELCARESNNVVVNHSKPAATAAPQSNASAASALPAMSLDCTGLSCPGPLMKLRTAVDKLSPGQELNVVASDIGFANDVKAFCRTSGLDVLDVKIEKGLVKAHLRAAGGAAVTTPVPAAGAQSKNASLIVFSRDLDKVLASLVIANGACAMGGQVTMFFTFWGLAALRKPGTGSLSAAMGAKNKSMLDRAMGFMLGAGYDALPLSQMNFGGMGPVMMKYQMESKNLPTVASLMAEAKRNKIRMIACTMSMEAMGISKEELIDGIELGGVADFMAASYDSGLKLFI